MGLIELSLFEFIFFSSLFAALLLWFVRVVKLTLFYLYLWQVKEYRIERFVDHFRSAKGKQLIFNKFLFGEVLLVLFPFSPFLFLLYGLDGFKTGFHILRKRLRKPIFTKKAIALSTLNIVVAIGFVILLTQGILQGSAIRFLALYSIFVPVIVSILVLGLQPFTILIRNRTLAKAKAKRETFKNLKVVGITGSYGKTSTKEFLAHILSAKFKVTKTPEHQNSEFGVANTILNKLTAEHQVFVCEMGAYKKGEIKALAEVVQPHIGIVTGVNEQHLATFGSMENLYSAEGGKELIEFLPEDGVALINQSVKSKVPNYSAERKVLYYGMAQNVQVEKEHVSFEVEGTQFNVPVYGGHNIENIVGAIYAARELGMNMEEIAKAAATMPLELSPLKIKKSESGATIIDSTYSANPDGVIADLEYLSLYKGKKVLIMPCLIELGSAGKEAHKKIGLKIAEVCDLAIITTKEHFEDIKQGMYEAEPRTCEIVYMENAQEIVEKIKSSTDQKVTVLLEGGKESRIQLTLLRSFSSG